MTSTPPPDPGAASGRGDPGGRPEGEDGSRDLGQAWDQVGERFAGLGRTVSQRHAARARRDPDDAAAGDPARKVIEALDDAFTALGDAVRDPSFQRQATETLDALGSALGATFTELGEQLRERFDTAGRSDDAQR